MGVICDHWFRVIQENVGVLLCLLCHAKGKKDFLWHLTSLENWINLNFPAATFFYVLQNWKMLGLWSSLLLALLFFEHISRGKFWVKTLMEKSDDQSALKKIFSTVSKACMGVHYLAFFVSLSFTFLISVGFIFSWICQVFHHERIWHLIVKKSVGKVAVLMSKAELENWSWPWRKVACFGEFCFIHTVAECFNISRQKWRIWWGVWSSVLWSVRWPAGASKDALLPLT